ncbi:MAG: rhomboid family intramembrane serine protease [Cyanobacteria bacterium SID2]|nr:rhomboid family intramembrane serine protease [Cyanobacteria bacterium SID2]MBP0005505.1 rhomboid family intramembrane serine protease [Cyanobacteria bacterium SBC]
MRQEDPQAIARELKRHGVILGGFVAAMWISELIDRLIFNGQLDRLGILPRHPESLRGILLMPFLHGNFAHLLSNTFPFLVLGWLVMVRGIGDFFFVTAVVMLASGLGVWIFGSPGFHIGASGVVFGYLGFLLLRGLFERSFQSIALSLLVVFFYGGLVVGVLPGQPGVSWEGHFFGLLGGILAAATLPRKRFRS